MELPLSPSVQKLILHWGEMGPKWGLNRSMAQIYALLFFTQQALTAEEITEALSMARSNVSTSIRDLQNWGIVKLVHKMGDRRDYFESLGNVWETLQRIGAARRKREVDPTIALLEETLQEMEKGKLEVSKQKVTDMLQFLQMAASWDTAFQSFSPGALSKLSRMTDKILKLVRGILSPEK